MQGCMGCSNMWYEDDLTFSVGVYAGIYISQNYEVPRVDEPAKIIERIKKFADEYKKK
ncbi:uncharacterized protein LOC114875521 isoform X2 [Osmia bicornis bicornis]|uniref:uncharacterized protein LOC114875521 isoform X2 n=1 Tax=Osmia bicornis bicornis TaxID=1437191 RepID=UPI0010F528F6|nr:uncharacterized protein LOC114875521 isoform X2 [Osmia bicornis bicornis]